MAADPKYLPGEEPLGEEHPMELRSELEDALDILVGQIRDREDELLELIARAPETDPVARFARAILLAADRRREGSEAEHLEFTHAAERAARIRELAEESGGAEPWTADTLAEYLASPREQSDISDEEFEEWVANIYRARERERI